MNITDELREWNTGRLRQDHAVALDAIADRIDERYAKARDKAYNEGVYDVIDADEEAMGYIKGPVDADGVPWHLGDKVDGMVGSITHLTVGYIGWTFRVGDAYTFQCERYRHHHEPTVEDVLREFAEHWNDPAHYAKGELVEQYAAKLRLAGEDA